MNGRLLALAAGAGLVAAAACNQVSRPVVSPGANAPQFLTAARPRMVVEVTSVNERRPDEGALALMLQRARERCNKPQGITVVHGQDVALAPVTSGVRQWSVADLQAFEAEHRTVAATPDAAVLYVVYVDGEHAGNPLTLALSYGDHSIAVFKDKLGSLEPSALVHELGHQLGLVNSGASMHGRMHEDLEHRGHSKNTQCVMYWRLESNGVSAVPPDDYDDDCKYDLKFAGGK